MIGVDVFICVHHQKVSQKNRKNFVDGKRDGIASRRQTDCEDTAAAKLAFDRDATTYGIGQASADGEAQAAAFVTVPPRVVQLEEFIEDGASCSLPIPIPVSRIPISTPPSSSADAETVTTPALVYLIALPNRLLMIRTSLTRSVRIDIVPAVSTSSCKLLAWAIGKTAAHCSSSRAFRLTSLSCNSTLPASRRAISSTSPTNRVSAKALA